MSDVLKTYGSGRLTKDAEVVPYGNEGKTLTRFSIASDTGTKDKPAVVFTNCTCFGKSGEAIAKYLKKGDQIFIEGVPTQKKVEDKYFYGVNISSWSFGQKKGGASNESSSEPPRSEEDNPFDDSDLPF